MADACRSTSFPIRLHDFLEGADLVVRISGCSKNSRDTVFSVCGGCITLGGGGGSVGHTATPTVLQPHVASAKVSHKALLSFIRFPLVLLS